MANPTLQITDADMASAKRTQTLDGVPAFGMKVESLSSSPYESGVLELLATETKLMVRWHGQGDSDWMEIAWHEVAAAAGCRSVKLADEIQFLREQSQREGYEDGFKYGSKEHMRNLAENRASIALIQGGK